MHMEDLDEGMKDGEKKRVKEEYQNRKQNGLKGTVRIKNTKRYTKSKD